MKKEVAPGILDFLQFKSPYRFRLETELIPSILEGPFLKAAERFKDEKEIKKIEQSKMIICEEVADVSYQVLKLICLRDGILTEVTSRILHDFLEQNSYYDKDGSLMNLDYVGLDDLSLKLVPEKMALELKKRLPNSMFVPPPKGDNGLAIIKDFIAGQLVAHISRIWTKRHMKGIQAVGHINDKKIPEETRELLEAIFKSGENLEGEILMNDIRESLYLSQDILIAVDGVRTGKDAVNIFHALNMVLKAKIAKTITIEDTLHLMFLKMKGRQEMTFSGFDEKSMRLVCKPTEYLIEADLFF